MFSFSHLSASHNSNNGNPKKHWRAPAWGDAAIWEAARRFAGITHRRIRRRRAPPGSWWCRRKHHVFSASAVPKVLIWEGGVLEVTSGWLTASRFRDSLINRRQNGDLGRRRVAQSGITGISHALKLRSSGISLAGCPATVTISPLFGCRN